MPDGLQNPTVSILIVAYESRGFIDACLSSVAGACSGFAHEILLTDNGTDGTEDYVRMRFPDVKVMPSLGNIGYGAGNNALAERANESSEFLLILNPDTELFPKAIDRLILAAQNNPEFGALSGAPRSDDDAGEPLPMVSLPDLKGVLYGTLGLAHKSARNKLRNSPDSGLYEVDALSGFFVLIRRSLWQETGGFDESFFLYGEDADLSKRLVQTGAKLGLVMSSQVKHDTGSGDLLSASRQHFKLLGAAHYANKHFSQPKRTAYKLALWLQCLTKYVGGRFLRSRSERLASMAKAYREPACKPHTWYFGYNLRGSDPRLRGNRKAPNHPDSGG